jgi:hypothetical protein
MVEAIFSKQDCCYSEQAPVDGWETLCFILFSTPFFFKIDGRHPFFIGGQYLLFSWKSFWNYWKSNT